MSSNSTVNRKLLKIRRNSFIETNYEPNLLDENPKATMLIEEKSPTKKAIKSRVKEMASMFNYKIAQLCKRDIDEPRYCSLIEEYSPESKQPSVPIFAKPLLDKSQSFAKLKNIPKSSACFVPENVFADLSVKEKAQLYTMFVDQTATKKKIPKNSFVQESEVKTEKHFHAKEPEPTQRSDSMRKVSASARNNIEDTEFEDLCEIELKKERIISSIKHKENELNQTTDSLFENLHIENLFFSWFQEHHDSVIEVHAKSNASEMDEEIQTSSVERLLEEAIAKLEISEKDENLLNKSLPIPRKRKNNAIESPYKKSIESEESESGLSSLPKSTSGSQPESHENQTEQSEMDCDISKSFLGSRTKKARKNIYSKTEGPTEAAKQITSTDSDSDGNRAEAKLQNTKLLLNATPEKDAADEQQNPKLIKLMKSVNSPRKIKSAYTLTINDLETPGCTPRPSLNWDAFNGMHSPEDLMFGLSQSFTDQGFETANDSLLKKPATSVSPPPPTSCSSSTVNCSEDISPGFSLLSTNGEQKDFVTAFDISYQNNSVKLATNISSTIPVKKMDYSTPIDTQQQPGFMAANSAKRLFSPIPKRAKCRRKSLYNTEPRRSSIAMQVIIEDQPLDDTPPATLTKNSHSETKEKFVVNSPPADPEKSKKDTTVQPATKNSHFWLKCGDYSMVFDIDYIDPLRLHTLYRIFSQTSCSTKELHFGIDNNKFPIHGPVEYVSSRCRRIPESKDCSHYWFSTGELSLPFNGKYLLPHKIHNLFQFIKATTEETGILRFGVDAIEFSNVAEFWHQPPKFSLDNQMLVDLQSEANNRLERRSTNECHRHTKSVMITDLDETSEQEADDFGGDESGHLFYSPFSSNHEDLSNLSNQELNTTRKGAMANLESFCGKYENDPLDQIFDSKNGKEEQQLPAGTKQQNQPQLSKPLTLSDIVNTVELQRKHLNNIQQQLANTIKPKYVPKETLDDFKYTFDYVEKLKAIITDIGNVGGSNNFNICTVDELDSYMYFLRRYAELCFYTCRYQMDINLDALIDYKPR